MKKLFLLIPALVFALITNAAVTNIDNGTPDALRLALHYANDGDVIVMAEGVYEESNSNYIAFNAKNVTVKAADGANVVIKPHVPFTVSGGARAEIQGVKIDASELCSLGSYSHLMYASDAAANNRLILDGCEIYGFALNNSMIYCSSSNALDALTINNSYLHNIHKSCVFVENSTNPIDVTITNSTFANITTDASSYSAGVIDLRAASSQLLVDHCTFYNVIPMNTDYSCVSKITLANGVVSNCIFMLPSAQDGIRAMRGVTANNCLTYNYLKDNGTGIHSSVTQNNCFQADPLFADAANDDFSLAGNWVTMNISPARGAATDGSDLGDPRWAGAETLPSTDFASPYQFVGDKALISGNIWYDGTNEHLYYDDKSECGTALWKIHATRACVLNATLNMNANTTTGHIFRVEILDADGHSISEVAEPSQSSASGNIQMPGTLSIPAEGDYTVILHNDQAWSSAIIDGFTLTYIGGTTINIPAEELVGTEAVIVDNGNLKVFKLANGNLQYDDNSNPLGEYVYWNINATKAGDMKVTLNVAAPEVGDASSHQFLVELYSDLNASPIASSAEASATSGTGARVLPDAINIPATGNYIIKLTNQKQWSSAILHSIQFEYLGGATIAIPGNALLGEEAVLVDEGHKKVYKDVDGNLQYDDNSTPLGEYVYWNINATKAGNMNVTLNVVAPASGHQFLVELYSDLNASSIASSAEASATSATGAIVLPDINIPATGNYIIKLTNQKQWSSAILRCIEIKYAGGAVVNVPGQILGEDALLYKTGSKYMIRTEEGYLKSSNNGDPTSEWAVWNIAATAGTMNVTLNLDPVTSSGHNYRVELYDGDVLKDYAEELASAELSDAVHSKGDVALEKKLVIPTDGNYTIKLINRTQWSSMILQGITFTPAAVLTTVPMNDTDEDNTAWVGNVGGAAVNVELSRTFTGGMYNTICLPFAVSSDKVLDAFGSGVELICMTGATLDGTVLDLEFAPTTSIYQGTPYLIKPAADVVNPQFTGVGFVLDNASAISGTNADFIGTFVKTTIPGDPNNLYLQANNMLQFSQSDVTIKGMHAYFHVKVPSSSPVVRPRIVLNGQVLTDIELVNGEPQTNGKFIENGQLIIIRDGIRYNAIGIRVK